MSGAKLAAFVHVVDEHDKPHVFGPGDSVPEWAARRITNPKAWAAGAAPVVAESLEQERERLLARLAELEESRKPDFGSDSGGGSSSRGGAPAGNASQEAWADWVLGNVEGVDEGRVRAMSRNELREEYGPRPE